MAALQSLQGFPAYALLLGLLVGSGFEPLVNEDILLLGAAALTLRGVMEPVPLIAVAWVGLVTADGLIFHWGHRFGARLLRHRSVSRMLPQARLVAMQEAMRRYGPVSIFAVRFMPGLRSALFFAGRLAQDPLPAPVHLRRRRRARGASAARLRRALPGRPLEEIVAVIQRYQGPVAVGVVVLLKPAPGLAQPASGRASGLTRAIAR